MRALVVYESMFGNTKAVAEAIADGLSTSLAAEVVEVGAAPAVLPDDVVLLVVGGPTHALTMSRPASRLDAAKDAPRPLVSTGVGVREWLAGLAPVGTGRDAATFDTKVNGWWAGSAARAIRRQLRGKGFAADRRAENFYVGGRAGPLADGELSRARRWGESVATRSRYQSDTAVV